MGCDINVAIQSVKKEHRQGHLLESIPGHCVSATEKSILSIDRGRLGQSLKVR